MRVFLALLAVLLFSTQGEAKPVSNDGCSGGLSKVYRLFTGKPPVFEYCCRRHDGGYAQDGTADTRLKKDNELAACVAETTPHMAGPVWFFVRVFGQPFQHFDWREYRRDHVTRWQYERDQPQ